MDATEYLRREHAALRGLFEEVRETPCEERRKLQALFTELSEALVIHERIEEEVFYPALAHRSGLVLQAVSEHHHMQDLLAQLQSIEPTCETFAEQFDLLWRMTDHHIVEDERVLFEVANELGQEELAQLGEALAKRKRELSESPARRAERRYQRTAWRVV